VNVTVKAFVALAAAALLAAAAQQVAAVSDLPDDVKPFWDAYSAAKQADDEPSMDKAVQQHRAMAERALGILLDDYCQHAVPALPDELRALAWSMDRVDRHERFINRVRAVLDLDAAGRKERYDIFQRLYANEKALDAALADPKDEALTRVTVEFTRVADGMEKLNEPEMAITALMEAASVEQRRNRLWERAVLLKRVVGIAEKQPFKQFEWDEAADELKRLVAQGYDPDKPKGEGAASAASKGAGAGAPTAPAAPKDKLGSFAPGSAEQTFKLAMESSKKGLAGDVLPTFYPQENFYLWTFSDLEGPGPKVFDTQRSIHILSAGKPWNLFREGAKFSLDSDGDGHADVSFTPTNTPELVEAPRPDGGTYPLMFCVPSDKEQQYGMDLNYEPQAGSVRLRFAPGGGLRGDVLGESWLIVDNNMSGTFGDTQDEWGDGFTPSPSNEQSFFRDPDAILIGKNRVAMPWSSVLPLADGFYAASIKPDGSELSLHKLQLDAGQVKLDCTTKVQPTHVLIEEVSGVLPGAILNVLPAKRGGTVSVPAGTWQFVMARLESGTKTGLQQARVYRGHAPTFEVKAGATVTLPFGAPYVLRLKPGPDDVKVDEEGNTTLSFWSMRCFGRGGEEYAQLYDEPLQPEVEVLGPDGKKLGKPRKTAVADIDAWQKLGEKVLFFPMPLTMTLPKANYTFKLSQTKAHGLLGGPFNPEEPPKAAGGKP
jgi:hypothetical protein